MWRNYTVIALRLLARNRVYAAINILGLALGLAGCLLILAHVRYERSYDSWLPEVLANLIASPIAWWAMRDWLNTFDLRIPLTITPFGLAGLIAAAIAVATVAGSAIRVARLNPIHALRYE